MEFGCRTSWWGRASSPARSIGDTSNFSARQLRASLDVVVGVGSLEDECSSYRGLWQARQQTKDVFTFTFTTRRNCCRSRASPARPQTQQRAALLQSLRGTMPALAAQAARNQLHDSQWIPPLSPLSVFSRRAQLQVRSSSRAPPPLPTLPSHASKAGTARALQYP